MPQHGLTDDGELDVLEARAGHVLRVVPDAQVLRGDGVGGLMNRSKAYSPVTPRTGTPEIGTPLTGTLPTDWYPQRLVSL